MPVAEKLDQHTKRFSLYQFTFPIHLNNELTVCGEAEKKDTFMLVTHQHLCKLQPRSCAIARSSIKRSHVMKFETNYEFVVILSTLVSIEGEADASGEERILPFGVNRKHLHLIDNKSIECL